jgi:aminoglycoside 3-N-acetyltransferase
MNKLFQHKQETISKNEFIEKLQKIVNPQTKYLYVHSGLNFGSPIFSQSRRELLQALLESIQSVTNAELIFPTYTFSYCNNEIFHTKNSKSKMGSLSEYVRNLNGAILSKDPLMSHAILSKETILIDDSSKESLGISSTFHRISQLENVEFLFFGVKLGDCFTYMHYLEKVADVPYRYEKKFTGKTVDAELGKTFESEHSLFVRYSNAIPNDGSYVFENKLLSENILKIENVGAASISCTSKEESSLVYFDMLKKNPLAFINDDFKVSERTERFVVPDTGMISL